MNIKVESLLSLDVLNLTALDKEGRFFFMYLHMTLVAGKKIFNCRYGKLIVRDATIFSNVILQHVIEFLCSIILKEGSYLEISKL